MADVRDLPIVALLHYYVRFLEDIMQVLVLEIVWLDVHSDGSNLRYVLYIGYLWSCVLQHYLTLEQEWGCGRHSGSGISAVAKFHSCEAKSGRSSHHKWSNTSADCARYYPQSAKRWIIMDTTICGITCGKLLIESLRTGLGSAFTDYDVAL